MTTLALSSADLTTLPTDALVVATAPAGGRKKGVVLAGPAAAFKAAPKRKLEEALAALGATGKAGDVVRLPGAGHRRRARRRRGRRRCRPVDGRGPAPRRRQRRPGARGHAPRRRSRCPIDSAAALDAVAQGAAARRLLLRRLPRRLQVRPEVAGAQRHARRPGRQGRADRSRPSPVPRRSPAASTSRATS